MTFIKHNLKWVTFDSHCQKLVEMLNIVFISAYTLCVLLTKTASAAFYNDSSEYYAVFDLNTQCEHVCETTVQSTAPEGVCKIGCNLFNPVKYINEPAVIKREEECKISCGEVFSIDDYYRTSVCSEGCAIAAKMNHKINFERVVEECMTISVALIVFPEVHFVFKSPANVTYQYRNFTCHKFLPANYNPGFVIRLFLLGISVVLLAYCTIFLLKLLDRFKKRCLPRYDETVPDGA